jgi:hypothetical protein
MASLSGLLERKEWLIQELRELGPIHQGTVFDFYRKCGKERCACAQPDHRGHGPQPTLGYKIGKKSRLKMLKTPEQIVLARRHIAENARYENLVAELFKIGQAISEGVLEGEFSEDDLKKKRLSTSKRTAK